ncbi:hypothetical protein [Anaerotignum sp. MB30-C6]|uniref:hypothetical protein n=1 Tax=Anaerotignum sp. MB30-C6 TaxID=3070814 RepID=UPI0027DE335E|nr:hypothetical protein [Anaerotignum sp. MB30-C6]WMI82020.1 hypothetical protein RBQ60_04625 [Anaerotignum sp. MB30-C6]
MSELNYFASDSPLEEKPNPYVKLLSVNQALEMGIEVDLHLQDNFDQDKPDVVLFCSDETKFVYPNIFPIDKDEYYDDIGTTKEFCAVLEWDYSDDTVDHVLEYIHSHLKKAAELELWSKWLGQGKVPKGMKKAQCTISDLTVDRLIEFYTTQLDFQCLTVRG